MNNSKKRFIIPEVIKAINESNDLSETILYENQIACMFASPIMFLGSVIHLTAYFLLEGIDPKFSIINALAFFVLGVLFEVVLRVNIKIGIKSTAINILYAFWFVFVFIRLFDYIGPAVWMVAFIQIIFAMSRIRKDMVVFVGTVTIMANLCLLFNPSDFRFELNTFYFVPQALLTVIMIILSCIVHKLNADRYVKLNLRSQAAVEQKNDIAALYEEISATEEELRHQNEQIRENEEILYELAYYDSLTEMPNRKMFMEQLDSSIEMSKQEFSLFYLVYIDLDFFKKINDTLGHIVGDTYIHAIAIRLSELVNKEDFIGRIGGDEFALIISRNLTRDQVIHEVENIRNGIAYPIRIENTEVRTTASFGISVFPQDGDNSRELLRHADMAMYKAKEPKNSIKFYEQYMQNEIMKKANMEKSMINGMNDEEFSLVFQPQYFSDGKKLRGIEALMRWHSPELGKVSPLEFIPLAEETGLIVPLGKWALEAACQKFVRIKEAYHLEACLSVNISTVQIKDPHFAETVKYILNATGLNPSSLELEITESVFIESINEAVPILIKLKALGVQIALDDFGTGFSSLSYLKLLPIDTLKIDKSFIDDLPDDPDHVCIVEDIISLGHKLGITVVAEGVEYSHQLNYLKKHSCDCIQGYLFSEPLDEQALEKLIAASYLH